MRVKVYITPRQGILDPQGRAIEHSLKSLGFNNVGQARMGKYIELDVAADSAARRRRGQADVRAVAGQHRYRGLPVRRAQFNTDFGFHRLLKTVAQPCCKRNDEQHSRKVQGYRNVAA